MNNNETVEVPLAMINTYLGSSDAERWPEMANALRGLLPKPKPRLVTRIAVFIGAQGRSSL